MESHTVLGEELLDHIDFPWDIRPMIRSHHERWDGTGYPDHLGGEQIPITARILKLADIFDALTTERSYRSPLGYMEAIEEMERDDGALDPQLLPIFKMVVSMMLEIDAMRPVEVVANPS